MLSFTRKRVFGTALVATLAIVVAGAILAFVSPSPHEVHTSGAEALTTQLVPSYPPVTFLRAYQPSESLNDVRCAMWRAGQSESSPCPDQATLAGMYFPNLTQRSNTLYIAWLGCSYGSGATGFNVEYQPSRRAIVIHCYVARPWFWWRPQSTMGAVPLPQEALLLVPTSSIPVGLVTIIVDDRVEHFGSDQSTDGRLGTATIS